MAVWFNRQTEAAFVVFIVSWEVKYHKLFTFWGTSGGETDCLYLRSSFFCLRFRKDPSRMAELNCGMKCLKFMLCVFNLFFWVSRTFDFRGVLLFKEILLFVSVIDAFSFILWLEQKQAFGFLIAVCGTNHSLMFKRGVTRVKFFRLTFNWDQNKLVRRRRSLL